MADGAEFDTRLVSFREHVESRDELKDRIAQIELEQAKQRAALMHLPDEVRRLSSLIERSLGQTAPQADHGALAMHRIVDALEKKGGGQSPFLLGLAICGAAAIGVAGALVVGVVTP